MLCGEHSSIRLMIASQSFSTHSPMTGLWHSNFRPVRIHLGVIASFPDGGERKVTANSLVLLSGVFLTPEDDRPQLSAGDHIHRTVFVRSVASTVEPTRNCVDQLRLKPRSSRCLGIANRSIPVQNRGAERIGSGYRRCATNTDFLR